jgi:histidinol-phosphatase
VSQLPSTVRIYGSHPRETVRLAVGENGRMGDDLAADLALARGIGDLSAEIALPFFRTGVRHDLKPDGSPVSEADFAVERAVLDVLGRERPGDGVLSEECGGVARGAVRRRWLIDPIDGTVPFLAGNTGWGTHVALEIDGEIVLGVITRPAERRSWWAAKGRGAWTSSGSRLQVSMTESLDRAAVSGYTVPESVWQSGISTVATWMDADSPILELIEGRVDAVISEGGFEWDHAPAVILLQEAGGRFTDPSGGTRIDLRGGLYSNGHLHEQVLRVRE